MPQGCPPKPEGAFEPRLHALLQAWRKNVPGILRFGRGPRLMPGLFKGFRAVRRLRIRPCWFELAYSS